MLVFGQRRADGVFCSGRGERENRPAEMPAERKDMCYCVLEMFFMCLVRWEKIKGEGLVVCQRLGCYRLLELGAVGVSVRDRSKCLHLFCFSLFLFLNISVSVRIGLSVCCEPLDLILFHCYGLCIKIMQGKTGTNKSRFQQSKTVIFWFFFC